MCVKNSGKLIYCATDGDADNLVMHLYACEKEKKAKRSTLNRLEEIDYDTRNTNSENRTRPKTQDVRSEGRTWVIAKDLTEAKIHTSSCC